MLKKMDYIENFTDRKVMIAELWSIVKSPHLNYVSTQNLTQVLSAMENIVLNKMILQPTEAE